MSNPDYLTSFLSEIVNRVIFSSDPHSSNIVVLEHVVEAENPMVE